MALPYLPMARTSMTRPRMMSERLKIPPTAVSISVLTPSKNEPLIMGLQSMTPPVQGVLFVRTEAERVLSAVGVFGVLLAYPGIVKNVYVKPRSSGSSGRSRKSRKTPEPPERGGGLLALKQRPGECADNANYRYCPSRDGK